MKTKTKSSVLISIFAITMMLGFFSIAIPVRASSPSFVVSPSGGDDTANLQAAFDAAIAAGPGSTVELTAGQFYTNAIFAENFDGTFQGAGKDLTTIDTLKGLYPNELGIVGPVGPYLPPTPHLFTFRGGKVHIKDLSFDIKPLEPAEEWGPEITDLLSIILVTGDTNSRIENIKCIGHDGTTEQYELWHPLRGVKRYNVRAAVIYGFGATGKHITTDCEFESIWLGISGFSLNNAEVKIMSNSIKEGGIGIINADNTNSNFEISGNYIEANSHACIWVMQYTPFACQWSLSHNILKPTILSDGIAIQDFTGSGSLEAVVSHNKIYLDTFWGGIWNSYADNTFIANNIICGAGDYGIVCAWAYNNLLLGNNVQNLDASWAPIVLLFASECVVVGGSSKINVLDIGGSNNIVVGMNNMQANSPGSEIQEAMEQRKEILQYF